MNGDDALFGRMERAEMAPVEVTAADFTSWVEDEGYAHQVIDLPEGLPFDEATCACGNPIGASLGEDDDGRCHGGWATTFALPDGTFLCEDCALGEAE